MDVGPVKFPGLVLFYTALLKFLIIFEKGIMHFLLLQGLKIEPAHCGSVSWVLTTHGEDLNDFLAHEYLRSEPVDGRSLSLKNNQANNNNPDRAYIGSVTKQT